MLPELPLTPIKGAGLSPPMAILLPTKLQNPYHLPKKIGRKIPLNPLKKRRNRNQYVLRPVED
jgi:hypothetical protein